MKKLITLILALAIGFGLKAQCPLTQAVDFTATDIHGTEVHLFDILNSGQYVLIEFFFTTASPCQQATPKVVESYYAMGCNMHDVFYMEISDRDSETNCLNWVNTYGIEYPTISGTAGGTGICSTYQIGAYPSVILIAPNRQIVIQDLWPINNAQSIITALEAQGLQQHDCNESTTDSYVITATANPAEGGSIVFGSGPQPGGTSFSDDFESGLGNWNIIDGDGDGNNWFHSSLSQTYSCYDYTGWGHNTSNGFAVSQSYSDCTYDSYDPNNFLVTKQKYSITVSSVLNFWADYGNDSYPDYFGVAVATADNPTPADFTMVWEGSAKSGNADKTQIRHNGDRSQNWRSHSVNLSAYAGQDVYIAFRHFNSYDQYEIYIDDVELTVGTPVPGQSLISDSFEVYNVGNKITPEAIFVGYDWWTTWNNSPGSMEDGVVANYNGNKCGHFVYSNDQVLLLDGEDYGVYNLEFDILVPEGKNGYFNVLHHFAGSGSTWAMQCFLHLTNNGFNSTQAPGHGTIHAGGNSVANFSCVYDAWMHFRLYVDSYTDVARFYYTAPGASEMLVHEWQWSLDSFGENIVEGKFDAVNFYPSVDAATSEFYVDNISFSRSRSESAPEANGGTLRTSGTYEAGSTCIMTAIANPGYTFTNWTKNGTEVSTNTTYSFTVTEDATYVANFEANSYTITATANPENGGTVTGGGTFDHGATCTLTATANEGYNFISWTKEGIVVSTSATYNFTVTEAGSYVANFVLQGIVPVGAINGLFSVGEGQQVYFSQGNLQYHATSNIWRFALNQFDCVGEDNSNISPMYNGWIDLFGWGTGNNPTNSSTNGEEYNTFNEWGNNIITNGDNTTVWRTLTNEEWQYLYFERNTASGIRFVLARVDNRCGLVLLPDSWSSSIYNLNNVNNVWGYNDNIITASVWASVFEPNGAVFLPAAGGREEGTIIEGLDWNGEYWSSTPSYYNPFHAWFHGSNIGTDTGHPSYYGKSVRLVHPVGSAATYTISATANPSNGGTVTGGGTFNQGATCTLTATANIGYSFVNWTENGDVVSTNASYSFTVAGNRSLVANFLGENSCVITFDLYDSYGDGWSGNTLVVTDDSGSSSELTFEDGSSSTQILMFVNGSHVTLTWIEGSWMGECSFTISYSSGDVIYHGENLNGDFMYEFDVNCNGSSDITQTTNLAQGWNWWSTYIEQDGIDGLTMLEESLGENGYQIKSQTDFVTNYGSMWFGMLSSIDNEQTYMIDNTSSCQVVMTGAPVVPSDHPITVSSGWNWIGYPCTNTMSVSEAFPGYTPANGDQVKSQSDYAIYFSGMWIGQLQSIAPGTGLMYLSNNATSTTLVYPDGGRSTETPASPKAMHWTNDIHAYPHNMTVMAVVELDGQELDSDNYELSAFDINGECRGSAKLTYVEPLDRHVAFLTVSGNDAVGLNFGLYNVETGREYFSGKEALVYVTNATIGNPEEPYVVRFRSTTGLEEFDSRVQIFPNPVQAGERISINTADKAKSPVRVEIVNAMGVETLRTTSEQTPVMVTAPSDAGVYIMRITVEGKGTVVRKLVVR